MLIPYLELSSKIKPVHESNNFQTQELLLSLELGITFVGF